MRAYTVKDTCIYSVMCALMYAWVRRVLVWVRRELSYVHPNIPTHRLFSLPLLRVCETLLICTRTLLHRS